MRLVLILAIALAGGYFAYSELLGFGEAKTSYRTAVVTTGPVREVVRTNGSVNAVVTVEVGSQLSGQIASLQADFNDIVAKGQTLAVIDQQSYRAQLSRAHAALAMARASNDARLAEVERAEQDLLIVRSDKDILDARLESLKAHLDSADADFQRKQELRARGTVAITELDQAQARQLAAAAAVREAKVNLSAHSIRVAAAQADVMRAKSQSKNAAAKIPEMEAQLELAEIELAQTTIRSPIDGIVVWRNVDAGQTVASSLEAPTLFTIAQDLSNMEVHARIDESDIGKIEKGQRATFAVDAYPGRQFDGVVVQIRKAPVVIQNVVTYTVVIRASNEELLLLPGMTALVSVIVKESQPSLLVPTTALQFKPSQAGENNGSQIVGGDGGPVVWQLDENETPRPTDVTVGLADNQNTTILTGAVTIGDEVIVGEVIQPKSAHAFGIRLGF